MILYRHPRLVDSMLRPFGFFAPASEGVLNTDVAYAHIAQVVTLDRQRHPEWMLPSAEIIPHPASSRAPTHGA